MTTKYGKTGGLFGDLNEVGDTVNGRNICPNENTYTNTVPGCDMHDDPMYNNNGTDQPDDDFYDPNGDLIVRTNDDFEVIAAWGWLGNAGGAEEEVTLTGTLPAGVGFIWDGIPGSCAMPGSSLSADRKTITCVRRDFDGNDVGSYGEDLAFNVRVEGDAINGSTPGDVVFTIDDPTASGPVEDGVRDGQDTNLIKVTAAPRWNIDKHGGAGYYTTLYDRVNPNTGEHGWELWYNFTIEVDEIVPGTNSSVNPVLGNEAMQGGKNATVTFTDDLSQISPHAELVTWGNNGNFDPATNPCTVDHYTNSDEPYPYLVAAHPERSIPVEAGGIGVGMDVTCTPAAGNTVNVEITGVDGTLTDAPTRTRTGRLLPVNRKIAAIGLMRVFVPLSDVQNGEDGIPGTADDGQLTTTNCISEFAPVGISGTPNFNGAGESEADNCRNILLVAARGSWDKNYRKGWSDQADQRAQWGGGGWWLPPTDASLVEAGDGTVTPAGVWGTYTVYSNTGGTPIDNPMLCDVIDVETFEMTLLDPAADNPHTFVDDRIHAVDLNYSTTELVPGLAIEYAVGYVGNWPPDPTEAPRTHAPDEVVRECSDPGITWYPDYVTAAAHGPVSKVRISAPALPPNRRMAMRIKHTARSTFLSTGLPIPNDTLLVNYASYKSALTGDAWRAGDYFPNDAAQSPGNGGGGDRLIMVRAKARILKTMDPTAVAPGNESTVTLDQSFTTDGPVSETDNVATADLLPKGLEYVVGSTAGTYEPGGVAADYPEPAVYPATDANCNLYVPDIVALGHPCGTLNGGTGDETILVWEYGQVETGTVFSPLTFKTMVAIDAPDGTLQNYAQISSPTDSSPSSKRVANANVNNNVPSSLFMVKSVLTPVHEINHAPLLNWMQFKVGMRNGSSSPLTNLDVIDLLPFNGDGIMGSFTFSPLDGTTVDRQRVPGTDFSGNFQFDSLSFDENGECDAAGITYWFTNSNATLDVSPANTSNTTIDGDPTAIWCEGTAAGPDAACGFSNAEVTAVRTRGVNMNASGTCFLNVTLATTGNVDENIYSNTAGSKATEVTNAVMSNTVSAEVYAGSIGDRVWHDSNNNGVYDAGEALEGVTVRLTPPAAVDLGDGPGVAIETQTDANGNYLFENLYEGDGYTVEVVTSTLPPLLQAAGANTIDPDGGNDSSATVNLGSDEDNLDQDFGYFVPASIGSRVWNDTDGDGIQDAGETGRAGVTVTLFDFAGNQVATTTTDGNGDYGFAVLVTGDYYVVFDAPAGLVFSPQGQGGNDALDSDADTATGRTATFHIDPGENDPDWDAGVTPPASIGNRVWNDADADGIQDAGESGVDGITVTLYDGDGTQVAQIATAGGGNYSFTHLIPGDYSVGFSHLPNNHVFTDQDVDNDDALDSDANAGTGRTSVTHLDPGENDMNWDAGIYEPASLGNFVWHDIDGDGVQDAGETGVGGVTVTIYDDHGNEVAHTTTAGNGSYSFTGLKPGSYTVGYTDLPDGYVFSPPNASGNDATDSNPGANGTTASITLAPGANNTTIDAGIYHPLSLGSRVWMDADADGTQDAGEPGISGVTVALLDGNGNPVNDPVSGDPLTTTTDADGNYLFEGLDPGDYSVQITPPAWKGLLESPVQVANADNNSNTDSNIASSPDTGVFRSGVVTLTSGGEPADDGDADTNTNLSVDFGFVEPASIGNFIWLDEDSDGIQDAGEPGVANVTVQLKDSDGNVIAETVTDSNGGYLFTGVPPGDYFVAVVPATLPNGLAQTPLANPDSDFGNQSQAGNGYPVHLGSGEENQTADFGYNYSPNNNLGALGDRIWIDSNGDGVQDDGEPGVGGAEVTLYSVGPDGLLGTADDVTEATTTTDANGNYIFDDLAAGAYAVQVTGSGAASHDILGAAYTQTGDPDHFGADSATAPDGTAGDNRSTQPIIIAPGDTFVNADFGYQPQGAAPIHNIGDTVWLDASCDGVKDADEPGIAGVVVGLKNAGGDFIATTTTDENGEYLFTDLPDGEYTVVVIDSDNVLGDLDPTYDADSLLVDPDGESGVTLAGADNLDQDFGYTPKGPNTGTGMIGDTIFLDRDGSGTPDPGEGLEGVVVILRDANGNMISKTATDENGNYFFGGLPAGDYTVEVDQTTLPAGVSNTIDPDGGDDSTAAVTLADGEVNLGQDFGYTADAPGSIGDQVFNDTNADGIYQPDGLDGIAGTDDDETPIEGVTLDLYLDTNSNGQIDPDEPKIGSTVTDANGNYLFDGLPGGDYNVKVTDENGKLGGLWHSQGADDTNDNSQEDHYAVALPAGGAADTADFGYYSQPGSLGDRVWNDIDGNGVFDPAVDSGIEGVTVYLDIVYPDGTTTVLQAVTDSEGVYEFPNLLLDEDFNGIGDTYGDGGDEPSHTVRVDEDTLPAGLISIYPVRGSNTDTTDVGGNVTDEEDTDMGSDGPAGEPGFPLMGSADVTNDFGYFIPASIGNTIWHDIDNDGVVDPGEALEGITVTLTPPADVDLGNGLGQPVEAVTGPNGEYVFEGLPPGDYTVDVNEDDLPPELQGFNTVDPDGGSDSTAAVSLGVGEDNVSQNFAYFHPSSIGNYVWDDSNGNGIQDPGESGHEGITVRLLDASGNPVVDPVRPGVPYVLPTGPNGEYLFENLVPGEYQVEFFLPSNNNFTTANSGDDAVDSDADQTTGRVTVVLGPSESNLTIDAGLVGPAVNIEKSTNGVDADDAPGVNVDLGDAITWTYVVTNTGNVPLTHVTVADDKVGAITCPSTTLAAGAIMTCTSTGTAEAGQYANTGSVVGTPPAGEAVVDTDTSHYIAISPAPAVDIEKYTNGKDADTGSGPIIAVGDTVTWTYVITNTGNVELTDVGVTDDKVGPITCPGSTLTVGASMICTATGIAEAGQYTNTGFVTALPAGGGSRVTDVDASHYLGSTTNNPFASVDIEKSTNGEDADQGRGPDVEIGQPVIWSYQVTNTGQVDLINVTVTDDRVAAANIHCLDDGNTDNRITSLAVGESVTCTATGAATGGQYENTGFVVGTPPEGPDVTGTDRSHYHGSSGSVHIEKYTNGEDADQEKGPVIKAGKDVLWTYVVTNTGVFPLTGVTVDDDQGVAVRCPKSSLAVGESMTCTGQDVAVAGQYVNIGTVTATTPGGNSVTDDDPSHYLGKSFNWNLFMPAILHHGCPPDPDFCYIVADGDNQGSFNAPLFKYTFKENKYELINRLGASDVEAIVLSLDGKILYGADNGILGVINPARDINDSFIPLDPKSHDAGVARGSRGLVRIKDIDGLAFDPTDGTLYGTDRVGEGGDGHLDLLVKLNLASGRVIPDGFGPGVDYLVIASSSVGADDIDDIAIDDSGVMFAIAGNSSGGGNDRLIIIDKQTGEVTDHGSLYHKAQIISIQDMESLTFYGNATLFGTTGTEFSSQSGANTLYRIERESGQTTPVISLEQNFDGLIPEDFEAIACFSRCQ